MVYHTLEEIKAKVDELASIIDAPSKSLPSYGQMKYDSHPYIALDEQGIKLYIVSERGREYKREKFTDIDELLYCVFSTVTFEMACDYELKNRIEDQDFRKILFKKQEELLGLLNKDWEESKLFEHNNILERFVFDDLAGLRATYCGELRAKGYSETKIMEIAYLRYPENSK
ncbi:MAG: Imm63 family immunity protein [Bacteroidota bacterium]